MSEASLISQARQGDGSVWEKLVGQHQEAVFRLAYLLLGDADEGGRRGPGDLYSRLPGAGSF